MKSKLIRVFLIFVALFTYELSIGAQSTLSRKGMAHLKAIETLKGMIENSKDKLQLAEEYEAVINCDPYYAPAYIEAAKIYSALTPDLGKIAYNKAKILFKRYAELAPQMADEVETDLIVLDAMLRKHANGASQIDGIWKQYINGRCWNVIEVSGNGTNVKVIEPELLFGLDNSAKIQDIEITLNGSQCSIVIQIFYDERPKLRKKGWIKFVDECDGNADPGFPRCGEYYYNEKLLSWTYTVDLTNIPLVMECEKIHTDYYLNGDNTYSDTDRTNMSIFRRKLSKE